MFVLTSADSRRQQPCDCCLWVNLCRVYGRESGWKEVGRGSISFRDCFLGWAFNARVQSLHRIVQKYIDKTKHVFSLCLKNKVKQNQLLSNFEIAHWYFPHWYDRVYSQPRRSSWQCNYYDTDSLPWHSWSSPEKCVAPWFLCRELGRPPGSDLGHLTHWEDEPCKAANEGDF